MTGFVTDGSPESFGKATDRLAEDPGARPTNGRGGASQDSGMELVGGRRHAPGAMMAADPRLGLLLGVTPPEELVMLCRELAHWVPVGDGRDGDYSTCSSGAQVIPPIRAGGRTSCGPKTVGRSRRTATGRCSSSPRSLPWNSSLLTRALRCDSSRASSTPDVRPGRLRLSCERAFGRPAGCLSMRSPQTAMGGPGPVSASRTDWQTQRSP